MHVGRRIHFCNHPATLRSQLLGPHFIQFGDQASILMLMVQVRPHGSLGHRERVLDSALSDEPVNIPIDGFGTGWAQLISQAKGLFGRGGEIAFHKQTGL
jgi:hypothetical protein